jgi:hypothetical protein
VTVEGGKAVITVGSSVDAAGSRSYSVTAGTVAEALEKLKTSAVKELVFRAAADGATGDVTLKIPAAAWASIAGSALETVTLTGGKGSITFDRAALAAIQTAAGGEDISLTIAAAGLESGLAANSAVQDSFVGTRPAVRFSILAGTRNLSGFGGGSAAISIPYTLAAGEDANAVAAYNRTAGGEWIVLPGSSYSQEKGLLSFRTDHFSVYAVGYNQPAFADTASSYAKDSITYLAARGIITGVSAEQFGLKSKLSRGDAALLLARLAGAPLNSPASGGFTDVKPADYFAPAVAWANTNGIVKGTGDGKFEPKAAVTREQLAVMIIRLADALNWNLPVTGGSAAFADQQSISPYALEAANTAVQAGLLSGQAAGGGSVNFAPQAAATREETAHLLAKLLKAVQ